MEAPEEVTPYQKWRQGAELEVVAEELTGVERDLFLLSVVEQRPAKASKICPKIKSISALKHCKNYIQRPHLWHRISTTPFKPRLGGGPGDIHAVPRYKNEVLGQALPSVKECRSEQTELQCRIENAAQAAGAVDASRECLVLSGRQRQECYFRAAESLLTDRGEAVVGDAIDLCMEAAQFSSSCLQHLTDILSVETPSADADEELWKGVLQNYEALLAAWEARFPAYQSFAEDQFWDRVAHKAYGQSALISGKPLELLPSTAAPHIRAALAFRLMSVVGPAEHTLEEWSHLVTERLTMREGAAVMVKQHDYKRGQPTTLKGLRDPKWMGIERHWSSDHGPELHLPAVHFRKDARRATDDDPKVDVQLVVLESAARLSEGHEVIREGLRSPVEVIHFTAHRHVQ